MSWRCGVGWTTELGSQGAGEVKLIGRHSVLGWTSEGLCLVIRNPHTDVWWSVVWSRRMYRNLWVKCTTPAGCKSEGKVGHDFVELGCVYLKERLFWKRWRGDGTWKVRIFSGFSGYFVNSELTGGTKVRVTRTWWSFLEKYFQNVLFSQQRYRDVVDIDLWNYFWNYISQQRYRGVVSSTEP